MIPSEATFSILTLGCRVNQADSERLRQILLGAGLTERPVGERVDFALVNTCTVTAEADRKSRQMIRRMARKSSNVVATGCGLAERGGLHALDGAFLRLPPAERERILELIGAERCGGADPVSSLPRQHRTRALLKVQEGCDHFCTYCIVPYVRGRSRSVGLAEVVAMAQQLEAQGYAEIVLTGIHLAMWGRDLEPKRDLADLLEELIGATKSVRYRISSIEPMTFPKRLISLMGQYPQRVCPHLHLALQHASDNVLAKMRRDYTIAEYDELAQHFLHTVDGGCLTTDILVGFPGETERDMELLLEYLHKVEFYHLHVFPYSQRRGTPAATYPDQVPEPEKKRRVEVVNNWGQECERRVRAKFAGKRRMVLAERVTGEGRVYGTADNFIGVEFAGNPESLGHLVEVEL